VEASEDGRMRKLAWSELRQQQNAPGVEYSFKYFQQVEGDIVLPPGVKPVRLIARLRAGVRSAGGAEPDLGRGDIACWRHGARHALIHG
jgi:hypothetical protein